MNQNQTKAFQSVLKYQEGMKGKPFIVTFEDSETRIQIELDVYPEILHPEAMASEAMAHWMHISQYDFHCKKVLDMGCGCGIQGIVALILGANFVSFHDIQKEALRNTQHNLDNLCISPYRYKTSLSDLFSETEGYFDYILFNYPFFEFSEGGTSNPFEISINSKRTSLQESFFSQAHLYLSDENAKVICPYWKKVGYNNNPEKWAKKYGYSYQEYPYEWSRSKKMVLQKEVSIYVLSKSL